MSDEQAFLNAIRDRPEDDTTRLVFADWLQEQGLDERAELIRVQCRGAAAEPDSALRYECELRERDLLNHHGQRWRAELPSDHSNAWLWGAFERGFVRTLAVINWTRFEERAEELLAAQPIERLFLRDDRIDQASRISACPHLENLRELVLGRGIRTEAFLEQITKPSCLDGLQSFTAGVSDMGRSLPTELASRGLFPNLKQLWLLGPASTKVAMPRAFFSRARWPELEQLRLQSFQVGREVFAEALRSPVVRRLRVLDLAGVLDRDALAAALRLRTEPLAVHSLNLSENEIDQHALQGLTRTNMFENARELNLGRCRLNAEAAAELTRAPFWSHLTELNLEGAGLEGELRWLETAPVPRNLCRLNLSANVFRDVRPLARWPGLASVEVLRLGEIEGALRPLFESPYATNIRFLKLRDGQLTDQTLLALLESPLMAQLHALDLGNNQIRDAGVRALAESPQVANLRRLSLDRNQFRRSGAEALLASPYLDRVSLLHVDKNGIREPMMTRLRDRFGAAIPG